MRYVHLVRRAGLALGASLLAMAASSAFADSTIKWLHLETNPDRLAAMQDVASAYETAHPGVKVELQFLENEAFKAKLPTLLQSDDPPSLFYTWGGGVLKEQSETGKIRPIDDAVIASQQHVADTFFALGLIPKSITTSDLQRKHGS